MLGGLVDYESDNEDDRGAGAPLPVVRLVGRGGVNAVPNVLSSLEVEVIDGSEGEIHLQINIKTSPHSAARNASFCNASYEPTMG